MKVLIISTDIKILEQGSYVFKRMKEYGVLVDSLDIVVCNIDSGDVVEISGNTRAHPTNSNSKIWYVGSVLRVIKKQGICDVDLVTAQDPFETGLAGWLAARKLKAKLQLQIHTDFMSKYFAKESLKNKIRVMIAKWLLPKADGIRVVSERIKKSVIDLGLPKEKITVLPIFVDGVKIQSAPITVDLHDKYQQFDFIILMTSRLEKEKNIEMAIDAMKDIIKKNPKSGLIIAGSGSLEKELKNRVHEHKLDDNIKFEGWVDDLACFYKTADIFLNTSNYEGYGMTLIMAGAAGRAIATTDVGVVGENINKDNAVVVDVGDKQAIVDAIIKLRSDEQFRKNLGKRAQESVSQLDSKEEYLEKYKKSWEL